MVLMYRFQLKSEMSLPNSQVYLFLQCFESLLLTFFVMNVDGKALSSESVTALQKMHRDSIQAQLVEARRLVKSSASVTL